MENLTESCCEINGSKFSAFKVESIISVDERGQMVLPKEIREKMNLKAGDKFAVAVLERNDSSSCCITLIKTDDLAGLVRNLLGPMFSEMLINSKES